MQSISSKLGGGVWDERRLGEVIRPQVICTWSSVTDRQNDIDCLERNFEPMICYHTSNSIRWITLSALWNQDNVLAFALTHGSNHGSVANFHEVCVHRAPFSTISIVVSNNHCLFCFEKSLTVSCMCMLQLEHLSLRVVD